MVSQALQRFNDNLPYNPYCSSDKWLRDIQAKEVAVKFPYIQVNYPRINYLVFDIDYNGAVLAPEERNLPMPTITAVNRDNGHAHLLYELSNPVPRTYSRTTSSLINDVKSAYRDILCADKCIIRQKQLIKNPLHSQWDINPMGGGSQYGLVELAEYIPKQWKIEQRRMMQFKPSFNCSSKTFEECYDNNKHSRNCTLFDYGRYYAYSIAHEHQDSITLYREVLDFIKEANAVKVPKYFNVELPDEELLLIANSITTWIFKNKQSFRKVCSGSMNLPTMKGKRWKPTEYKAEVKSRRQQSAYRTHDLRRQSTSEKIVAAREQCIKDGVEPTTAVVSKLSGINRTTITRSYYGLLQAA
jgi:hypothetical protein